MNCVLVEKPGIVAVVQPSSSVSGVMQSCPVGLRKWLLCCCHDVGSRSQDTHAGNLSSALLRQPDTSGIEGMLQLVDPLVKSSTGPGNEVKRLCYDPKGYLVQELKDWLDEIKGNFKRSPMRPLYINGSIKARQACVQRSALSPQPLLACAALRSQASPSCFRSCCRVLCERTLFLDWARPMRCSSSSWI